MRSFCHEACAMQVFNLLLLLKMVQTSLILTKRPPKPYKLLKFSISLVTTIKSRYEPSI